MAIPMLKHGAVTRTATEEERLWRAVLARDAREDGRFVYAVRTTGVYCRPVCPSRRAKRENVSFYKSGLAARAAGFRACKRCRPDAPGAHDAARRSALDACRYIEAHAGRIPTLAELGREVGLSPAHLQRVFTRVVGVSPRKYADTLRVDRLKRQLRSGDAIAGALYSSGYGSTSRLYEKAGAQLGMTPSAYRKRATGERIRFVTFESPIGGHILVAATERGICSLRLGDRVRPLHDELAREFASARLEPGDDAMRERFAALVAAGGRGLCELPYDVQATAFQRRVWEAIREIPAGSTATYGELAASIGAPRAVRAVAQACAKNPVALVSPLSPRGAEVGWTGRLPLGCEAQASASAPRARVEAAVERIDRLDWVAIEAELDARGCARAGRVLDAAECAQLVALHADDARFRSRVDMERHRFGRGDYAYFAHPLPDIVADLRRALYPRLAPIANAWMERLRRRERYPDALDAYLARCHQSGQTRPTPLLLHYEKSGFNCLHRDLYGPLAFPLQAMVMLCQPGTDFTGGEFLVVENRARQQSIGTALSPQRGELVVFAVNERPVPGKRGFTRAALRHGVSTIESGERYTLGIIFHDAA